MSTKEKQVLETLEQNETTNKLKPIEQNDLINQYLDIKSENNTDFDAEKEKNLTIGENGISVGASVTFTGNLALRKRTINEKVTPYFVLETVEGIDVPIKALMGISSDFDYKCKNTDVIYNEYFVTKQFSELTPTEQNEYESAKDENDNVKIVITEQISPNVCNNFKFSDAYKPKTRNFLEFVNLISCGVIDFTNKKCKYLGTIVKQGTSKKDQTINGQNVKIGYKRAFVQKLYQVID
jgi:hypothetical protein